MTSMTERCFGSPGKCWVSFMDQGEGAKQTTKGLCAPLTYSHVTRGFGAPHLGFPPPGLGAKSPEGEIPSALAAASLGETLGRLPFPLPLYIVEVLGLPNTGVSLSQGAALPLSLLVSCSAWRSPAGVPRSSTTTTPSCCCWTESSPTSPSPLAGSRHGRRHRAARVLNVEAPLFGA